ncbi:MAG: sigma-70 family RNA polymerase sigma factor [Actinomycetota bacterium]
MSTDVGLESFEAFASAAEPRLRQALSASLGSVDGADAAADALAYGWEHWDRVSGMENPRGYLYTVGRNLGRRRHQTVRPTLMPVDTSATPWVEPGLPDALSRLSENQRVAVMLVHCFQWTLSEVGEFLDVSKSSVQTHLERGLDRLRNDLGVTS